MAELKRPFMDNSNSNACPIGDSNSADVRQAERRPFHRAVYFRRRERGYGTVTVTSREVGRQVPHEGFDLLDPPRFAQRPLVSFVVAGHQDAVRAQAQIVGRKLGRIRRLFSVAYSGGEGWDSNQTGLTMPGSPPIPELPWRLAPDCTRTLSKRSS
jgi:hypothetical protein